MIRMTAMLLAAAMTLCAAMPLSADPPADKPAKKPADKDSKPAKVERSLRRSPAKKKDKEEKPPMPALSFKMKDIDGAKQDLRQYYGQVVLMVNVASECGLTPQYADLQKLYEKYRDQGFVVLGFPANEFGRQEPGSDSQIREFCTSRFDVTFPMFSKVVVKGEGICDLYEYLTDTEAKHDKGGEIEWNFAKFLVNRRGEVVERFHPRKGPMDAEVVAAVERLLKEAPDADSPWAKAKKKREVEEKREDGKDSADKKKDAKPRRADADRAAGGDEHGGTGGGDGRTDD